MTQPIYAYCLIDLLLGKSCLKSCKLVVELSGNSLANLSVELSDCLAILKPERLVNGEKILNGINGDIKTCDIDILSVGNIADRSFNSVNLALATVKYPHKNSHVIAKAGPDEVTLVIGSEPVNVENLGSVCDFLAHAKPMCPIVTHVIANEGTHCHRITANYADSACRCSGSLGSHDGTDEGTVLPAGGLIYEGSSLSAAAAEYDSGDRNTCGIGELIGDAGAVLCLSGKSGVGVSAGGVNLISLVVGSVVPLLALPVDSVRGGIIVEPLPPNGVVIEVVTYVGEDTVTHSGMKRVGVGALVGTGSNAEEAVLGVYCPESAVLTDTKPCDVVTYAPYLIALVSVHLGGDEHSEVGLTASRGECRADILDLTVGILNTEDKHVLSHPPFLTSKVRSDTKSEALLAKKNVAAISGVNGPDSVILREMAYVSVFLINIRARVQTLDEISAVAKSVKNVGSYSGHDEHVKHNVDRVGKLDAVLSKVGAHNGHGIRDYVHGLAAVRALVELGKLRIALCGSHPIVNVSCILLLRGTDEGSVLNARNVVDSSSVKITAGECILVELDKLARCHCLRSEGVSLLCGAINENNLGGLDHGCHFGNPLVHELVFGYVCVHSIFSL